MLNQTGAVLVLKTLMLPLFKVSIVFLQNIAQVIVYFAGLVFFIMFIRGGFSYLTSGGDPKKTAKATSTLTMAIIGLVGVIVSFLIIKFIDSFTGVNVTEFNISQFMKRLLVILLFLTIPFFQPTSNFRPTITTITTENQTTTPSIVAPEESLWTKFWNWISRIFIKTDYNIDKTSHLQLFFLI